MLNILKVFLKGIIYTLALPFLLIILVGYSVYLFFIFIYLSFKNVIVFFSGGTPLGDLKEDVEAKRKLTEKHNAEEMLKNAMINAAASMNAQAMQQAQNAQYFEQPSYAQISETPIEAEIEEKEIDLLGGESND